MSQPPQPRQYIPTKPPMSNGKKNLIGLFLVIVVFGGSHLVNVAIRNSGESKQAYSQSLNTEVSNCGSSMEIVREQINESPNEEAFHNTLAAYASSVEACANNIDSIDEPGNVTNEHQALVTILHDFSLQIDDVNAKTAASTSAEEYDIELDKINDYQNQYMTDISAAIQAVDQKMGFTQ